MSNIQPVVEYAGFWRRLFAVLIDTTLYSMLITPIFVALYGRDYFYWQNTNTEFFAIYSATDFIFTLIVPIALTITFWRYFSATPGKLLLDCKIAQADTLESIHWKQASLRYLAYIASTIPLYLGFVIIGLDKRKQGLHDKLAKTVVLHTPHNYANMSLQELMEPFE